MSAALTAPLRNRNGSSISAVTAVFVGAARDTTGPGRRWGSLLAATTTPRR
jgi:hypothetical protein